MTIEPQSYTKVIIIFNSWGINYPLNYFGQELEDEIIGVELMRNGRRRGVGDDADTLHNIPINSYQFKGSTFYNSKNLDKRLMEINVLKTNDD